MSETGDLDTSRLRNKAGEIGAVKGTQIRDGKEFITVAFPDHTSTFPKTLIGKNYQYVIAANSLTSTQPPEIPKRDVNIKANFAPEDFEDWKMTDPNHHDPDNFRYIVHSLSEDEELTESMGYGGYVAATEEGIKAEKPVNPLDHPEEFMQKKFISASLIDQSHIYTSGTVGLILTVPYSNILSATPDDMGSDHSEITEELIDFNGTKLPSPDQILDGTSGEWNEVLIRGKIANGKTIGIGGVFIIKPESDPTPARLEPKVKEFAEKYDLPIIVLR